MYIIFRTHARLQQRCHKQRLLLPILNPINPAESNVDSLNQYHTLHYTKPAILVPFFHFYSLFGFVKRPVIRQTVEMVDYNTENRLIGRCVCRTHLALCILSSFKAYRLQ